MNNSSIYTIYPSWIALLGYGVAFAVWIILMIYISIYPTTDEDELRSRYKTEVVDCHPFDTPPPISYEQWRAEETQIRSGVPVSLKKRRQRRRKKK